MPRKRIFSFPSYNFVLSAKMPLSKAFPPSLDTVGDHIRTARLQRGLEQHQVARILEVTDSTVWNWENHRSSPPVPKCKRVIEFLGYDPFPLPQNLAEQLVSFRRTRGLRVKDAAALAKVDPASWSSWERTEHSITGACRHRIELLLHG